MFVRGLGRRSLLAGIAGMAGGLLGTATRGAQATAFPERAVRIVVPYSVGVGPDVVARSVGERLAQVWKQPVVIDNKPGASGIVAFGEVRRTPRDGHTLFLADASTMAVNPLLHASLPYDPVHDLVALSLLFRATFVLWVGGQSRFRNVADLLDAARQSPARVSYATLGNGHPSHLAIETLLLRAGVRMLHVPFKDAGALFSSVVTSEVDFTAFSVNTVAGLMASGRLRPLAVAAKARLAAYPNILTLAEAGGPAVEMHPWAGLVAVAGTPAPVLVQLHRDIVDALGAPEVRRQALQTGFEITPSTPSSMRQRIEADVAAYAPLIAEGRVARV